jgi:hypothetical protein
MSISGRINIDVLFHDADGEDALRVVSLESSEPSTTGIVALVRGTHGTSSHTVNRSHPGYTNPAGQAVSFSTVSRIALKASRPMTLQTHSGEVIIRSDANRVAFTECNMTSGNLTLTPLYTSGTASYTVFLYGT